MRFELYKVDVIESIVQRYLPKAPFLIRPKRKLKAVDPSRARNRANTERKEVSTYIFCFLSA